MKIPFDIECVRYQVTSKEWTNLSNHHISEKAVLEHLSIRMSREAGEEEGRQTCGGGRWLSK